MTRQVKLGVFLFFSLLKGASDDCFFIYSRAVVLNLRGVDFAPKNHLVMSGEVNFACHICGVGQWLLEGGDQGCSCATPCGARDGSLSPRQNVSQPRLSVVLGRETPR